MKRKKAVAVTSTPLVAAFVSLLTMAATPAGAADAPELKVGNARAAALRALPVTRLIVKYKDESTVQHAAGVGSDRMAALSARTGVELKYLRAMSDHAHVLRLGKPLTREQALALVERLRADPAIALAEIDERQFPHFTPNDPLFNDSRVLQWNLVVPTSDRRGGANLSSAWDVSKGSGVVTAFIDTGIVNHPDVEANVIRGYDFISDATVANDSNGRDSDPSDPGDWIDDSDLANSLFAGCEKSDSSWHGTGVGSIAAGLGDNGTGLAGIAFQSKVLIVRALGKCFGYSSDISDAIRWAAGAPPAGGQTWTQLGVPNNVNPAKIVNLSLGSPSSCSSVRQSAIDAARAAGAIVFAATGNEAEIGISNPANCNGVVAVTAHTIEGDNADYANVGPGTALSAPGGGDCTLTSLNCLPNGGSGAPGTIWRFIPVAGNDGATTPSASTYYGIAGTSAASPHAAGVAALLLSAYPTLDERKTRGLLVSSTRTFPSGTYCAQYTDGRCGTGMLDAGNAMSRAAQAVANPLPATAASVLPASRSVAVGNAATAFVTVINTGAATALGCEIAPTTTLAADFWYQTTSSATNALTGQRNRPVDIAAGAAQSFMVSFTPTAAIASTDVNLRFDCVNAGAATAISGVNTLLLSATTTPGPDVIALGATAGGNGIVNIPGTNGTGAFAVATANVGATASITVSADTGSASLPLSLSVCQTNPSTGACIGSPAASVTTSIAAGATPTFAVFATGQGTVAFNPATNRVFVRFRDSGNQVRGATSVAVRTQ